MLAGCDLAVLRPRDSEALLDELRVGAPGRVDHDRDPRGLHGPALGLEDEAGHDQHREHDRGKRDPAGWDVVGHTN